MTFLRQCLLFAVVGLVAYLAGTFSATFDSFPYPQLLERPTRALRAYLKLDDKLDDMTGTVIWREPRFDDTGVVTHDPDRAHDGLTFFSRSHDAAAVLVDMDGEVVHEWRLPFSDVWPDPPHTKWTPDDKYIYWRRARLMPDGDVIAIYTTPVDSPYGYGMVRVDADSNLVWSYADNAHHDFAVADDGSVYTLVQGYRSTHRRPVDGMPQLPDLVMDDALVRLGPDGEERDRLNLLDLLADSEYRYLLQMDAPGTQSPAGKGRPGDVLHTNTVSLIDASFARHHDFADPGDLLVSFRPLDTIAIVSMQDREITWATRGFWTAQHDPDPLPNGNILLFDNKGHGAPGAPSRVVEFDPVSKAVPWMYAGTANRPLWSNELAAQQRLPNGNVLITSSQTGRLLEVTRDGEIVWEYLNDVRRTVDGTDYTSAILEASRYSADDLDFDFAGPREADDE